MSLFLLFKNIGYIVVVLTFIKAVYEYMMALKWKKSEFLSKECKDFFSDPDVRIVCSMLDYNIRKIELRGKEVVVDDDLLYTSLQLHIDKKRFSTDEANIRDLFDIFFDKLSNFNILIKNGLVNESQVVNYIEYYIEILWCPGRKSPVLIETFNKYIDFYDFKNIRDLINLHKKSLKETHIKRVISSIRKILLSR